MTTPARNRFDEAYQSGTPPWVIGQPQAAVVALEESGAIRGTVLDVGCGLGEHTILLASLGYDVLGVDFSPNAVARARANAAAERVDARFEVRDALALGVDADQAARYDTVLDSALFHVFGDDADRARYVASLHGAIRPGGVLHLLALSDEGRGFGPSVGEDTIRTAFTEGWDLETLDVTTYRGIVGAAQSEALDLPVGTVVDEPAWLARVRRR